MAPSSSSEGRSMTKSNSSSKSYSNYEMSVFCHCGLRARLCTSKTNDNPWRRFYTCSRKEGRCNFFEWHDKVYPQRCVDVINSLRNGGSKEDFENLVNENKILMRIHPSHWCKAFFKTHSSCDIVDNNLTEAFNASIVEARHLPIISMLEHIRRGIMTRVLRKVEQCKKWKTPICPRIRTKFENTKDISRWNMVLWGCDAEYEVSDNQDYYVVNMRDSTCTCRVWDLQGIPCRHAVAAMTFKKIDVYTHVSMWYSTQVFSELYTKHHLSPMAGDRFWPESDLPPLTPPPFIKQTGRPKKKRIQEPGEGGTATRVSRKGRILRCNECWLTGHNVRKCPIVVKRKAEAAAAKATATSSSCITMPLKVSTGKRKREIEVRKRGPGIQIHDTVPTSKRTTVYRSPQKKWGSNNVKFNKFLGNAKGASASGVKKTTREKFPTQESRKG